LDPTERACLPSIGLGALILGAAGARETVAFDDIAPDGAPDLGFPKNPLTAHPALGVTTSLALVALACSVCPRSAGIR